MARAQFLSGTKLELRDLHGYAIDALFGLNGFEDNFRIYLASRTEIGTKDRLKWDLAASTANQAATRPVAQLDVILDENTSFYKFAGVTLKNRSRIVNGAERYHLFEFAYVDQLRCPEKGKSKNPIDMSKANFKTPQVAHHSGQTVLLAGASKPLLGIEALQDAQAATVIRTVSHRTTANSWLSILNDHNWKPQISERLKWNFTLTGNRFDIDGEIDNQTVVHYRETYGIFNVLPNPDLAGYTEPNITRHCLNLPVAVVRPSAPANFVDAQHTVADQERYAGLVLKSFIETVTVKFGPGRYQHVDLG